MNKKRLYRRLIILFIAFSAVAFTANKWYSSIVVKNIEIKGNRLISSEEISKSLKGAIIGKIKDQINLRNIEEIISSNPYILSVHASFQGRSCVELNIVERVPVAKFLKNENVSAYVDKYGIVLPPRPGVDINKLPTLTGVRDDNGSIKPHVLNDLVNLLKAINESGIRKEFSKNTMLCNNCGNIEIKEWSGIASVIIGRFSNIAEKLASLEKCLDGAQNVRFPKSIDLRWSDRVVVSK